MRQTDDDDHTGKRHTDNRLARRTQREQYLRMDHAASLAVIRKLGFAFVREAHDDVDGLEHVYHLLI
jgi:hypothetical protein